MMTAKESLFPLLSRMLTKSELRRWAGHTIYERGKLYFRQGRVRHLDTKYEPGKRGYAYAEVKGQRTYRVEMQWNILGEVYGECTCPYAQRGLMCKHIVATALAVMEHEEKGRIPQAWESALEEVLSQKRRQKEPAWQLRSPYYLAFRVQKPSYNYYSPSITHGVAPYYYRLPEPPQTEDTVLCLHQAKRPCDSLHTDNNYLKCK